MNSGTAVRASEKLWMVSASKATEPVATISATWMRAVTIRAAKEMATARMPRSAGLQRRIQLVGGVVAVRPEKIPDRSSQPPRVQMLVVPRWGWS